MNKAKFISRIMQIYPYMNANNIKKIITIFFDTIVGALERGERVELRGFGSFSVKHKDAEKKRNPKTGESVFVEAHNVPFFRAGKQLKVIVNTPIDVDLDKILIEGKDGEKRL